MLGASEALYYFAATTQTGGSAVLATGGAFANSANTASVVLASNGDFTYSLAAAAGPSPVPLPAAAWLMGSGLVGIGGFIRRRKTAAEAVA